MEFCIKREELIKALADLDTAATNGFEHAEAVFTISGVGPHLHQCQATYGSPLMRAHKDDEKKNWGRFQGWDSYRYDGGRLVFKEDSACTSKDSAAVVSSTDSSTPSLPTGCAPTV
jgi:hypothetical protein